MGVRIRPALNSILAKVVDSIGVMLGVYASGVSGAHINPAVTFANCVFRKFPWRKFPIYMLAQVLGAMCAAGVVYGMAFPRIYNANI